MPVTKPARGGRKRKPPRTTRNDPLLLEIYLQLLGQRVHTTASLARHLGVSTATVSRGLRALRRELARKGMEVVSRRAGRTWRLSIDWKDGIVRVDWNDPLFQIEGMVKEWDLQRPWKGCPPGTHEDDVIYRLP